MARIAQRAIIALCAICCLLGVLYWVYRAFHTPSVEEISRIYNNEKPKFWGEKLKGITSLLPQESPAVYLTFDACGGEYDKAIIDYLKSQKIPATLFINARWIDRHLDAFLDLANEDLFSIQNHGTRHRPLSVNGREVYGIKGTHSPAEVYEEIMANHKRVKALTGKSMRYFRSGTAYYDEVAIKIAKDLGYEIGGFDVLGDAGATFSKEQIIAQLRFVRNGSILIFHFNHPQSATLEGIKAIVPKLQAMGYEFRKL